MKKLNIVVVGAGFAGLCVAKYAISFGHSVTIFEQCAELGGTWIYRESTGVDEYGLNMHTSMYHNLRTTLPKEVMGFRDYPMQPSSSSYILSDEVLSYLRSYAQHFKLNEFIKFKHHVVRVNSIADNKWEVEVKNLPTNQSKTYTFDAIFVCNGHNSVPLTPDFDGAEDFQGRCMHSHDYRRAEAFNDKTVLIIGAGPSGVDLAYEISEHAKTVIFSHHTHNERSIYPSNLIRKGPVKRFNKSGVVFTDDSEVGITDIIYCTGYDFTIPFLSENCGIHIDDKYIYPLYKHCINAEHPTMAVIGIMFGSAVTQMIELQVRFVMQFLNGYMILPSRDEMRTDSENELKKRLALGWKKKKGHCLGPLQREYFNDLATTANIENVREIFVRIFEESRKRRMEHLKNYRNTVFTIIDEDHFECTTLPSN